MKSILAQVKKKGQMAALPQSIIALVVAVLVLVIGIVIIQELRDTSTLTTGESGSYLNETLTTVTESGETLTCGLLPVAICSFATITNSSDGEVIQSANYTTNSNLCTVSFLNASDFRFNNTDWNVTYSCTFGGSAYTSSNASLVAVGDFSDFIPIIVIALAASIIIGLILVGFAFRRRQR